MLKLSKAEFSVLLMVLSLTFSVFALIGQAHRASEDAINRSFSNAEGLIDFVAVASRHYIESTRGLTVAEMTAYPDAEPYKPWLPATFAMRISQSYNDRNPNVNFRLYSADPFEFNRNRQLDGFAQAALDRLLPGGIPEYRAVEQLENGSVRVRLARAFKMGPNCVGCHNRPEWGLQKQDWQAGDVRGVWEASILINPSVLHSQAEIFGLFMFIAIALILGAAVVFPAVRREVKSRAFFHDRSISM